MDAVFVLFDQARALVGVYASRLGAVQAIFDRVAQVTDARPGRDEWFTFYDTYLIEKHPVIPAKDDVCQWTPLVHDPHHG